VLINNKVIIARHVDIVEENINLISLDLKITMGNTETEKERGITV